MDSGSPTSQARLKLLSELREALAEDNLAGRENLDQLTKLVRRGVPLSTAMAQVAPARELNPILMRRASFLRVFDRALFEKFLQTRDGTFESFVALPGVEPITERYYRVKDTVAVGYLQEWIAADRSADRAEIRAFAKDVSDFVSLPENDYEDIDILRYQVAANPDAEVERFNAMFRQADDQMDLAQCHALLQMLRDLDNLNAGDRAAELRLLDIELRKLCDNLTPYVTARGRFLEDWAKSKLYLERKTLRERTLRFASPEGEWLLPIYGAGGRGKSIFLQWFVGRYCVPREQRIPVAKIDFDDINVAKLATSPQLILLRIADQLDRQIERSPFGELPLEYGKYGAILLPSGRIPKDVKVDDLEKEFTGSNRPDDLQERFTLKLLGMRAIAILDTVEEAVIHYPRSMRAVLAVLRAVHQACPQFKLVLSGRNSLLEKHYLDAQDPAPIEITLFLDEEARTYLKSRPEIPPDDRFVRAMIQKAQGNPFALALLADLVKLGAIKTVEEVEEQRPEFEYLIRKIIDRIPDRAVHWVVRYGVIPRRLTLEFLNAVMIPRLREEDAKATHDGVTQFSASFPRGLGTLDGDTLWNQLRSYAAANGWLRDTAEGLRFQPEVVKPMRALLMLESIHRVLHQDARDWFEKQADEPQVTAERWLEFTGEALYHRFVLEGIAAEPAWRKAFNDPRAAAPAARRRLLEVLTGFVEQAEDGRVSVEAVVDQPAFRELAGWALLQHALSLAGIAYGPCVLEGDPGPIRDEIALARQLYSSEEWPEATLDLIEMAIALNQRDYRLVRTIADRYSPDTFRDAEGYCFALLTARAFAGLRSDFAELRFESAYRLLGDSAPDYPRYKVLVELAEAFASMGKLDRAVNVYQSILSEVDRSSRSQYEARYGELLCGAGSYEEALQVAESIPGAVGPLQKDFERLRLTSLAAQGRIENLPETYSPGQDGTALEAAKELEMAGIVSAARFDLASAVKSLEDAYNRYRRVDPARADPCLNRLLRLLRQQKGDFRRAVRLAESAEQTDEVVLERTLMKNLSEPDAKMAELRIVNAIHRKQDLHPILESFITEIVDTRSRYRRLRIFRDLDPVDDLRDIARAGRIPPPPEGGDYLAQIFDYIEYLRFLKSPLAPDLLEQIGDEGIYPLYRKTVLAAKMNAKLPSLDAVLAHYRRWKQVGIGAAMAVRYTSALLSRGQREDAARLLEAIGETLPAEVAGSEIEAEHFANRGRANWSPREKNPLLLEAARMLDVLGQRDTRLARELLGTAEPDGQPEPAAAEPQGARAVIELSGIVAGTAEAPGTFGFSRVLLGAEAEVKNTLRGILSQASRAWVSKKEVELQIDNAQQALLPWEMAFDDDVLCFRSSRFLTQASYNPYLRFANYLGRKLSWVRRLLALVRPQRVFILRQPVQYQERNRRGFDLVSRRPLAEIYRSSGATVFEPDQMATGSILESLKMNRPSVIHVQAPLFEFESGITLDLEISMDMSIRSTELVTPDYFASLLKAAGSQNVPLLILDPPRPSDESECARQLLLRNRFADELVASGCARMILGSGLFEASSAELAALRLAQEITLNPEAGQLFLLHRSELGRDRFSRAAALFTLDPRDTVA